MSLNKSVEIEFWIREGKNLENKKLVGSNAPYAEVSINNETKRTSISSNLNNPKWNEKLMFRFDKLEDIPNNYVIKLKDENTLLPNPLIGEYNGKLDHTLFNNYQQQSNNIIQDGFVRLENSSYGELDFQILFKYCDQFESNSQLGQQNQYGNEMKYEQSSKQEMAQSNWSETENKSNYEKMDQNETHILPTIHVQAKPTIVEKEVEYHKPVEIKETIVHKEKPIVVEQPIIKETFEHVEQQPQYEQHQQNIIKQSTHEKDVGNLDQQALENLREQRKQEFMDTKPIVEHQKERVELDTEYHEQPTQVKEKEVVYQQPIEIEKQNVEQVIPKVKENVTLQKEHVYQKLAPDVQQNDAQVIQENQKEVR